MSNTENVSGTDVWTYIGYGMAAVLAILILLTRTPQVDALLMVAASFVGLMVVTIVVGYIAKKSVDYGKAALSKNEQ